MWKKNTLKKKLSRKGSASLLKNSLWGQFSVPARVNQPAGFSVRGTSTPYGLFQIVKILMGYTIHQIKHGVLLSI